MTNKVNTTDVETMKKIRAITSKGNNVEVKQDKDGNLKIYEVKKTIK